MRRELPAGREAARAFWREEVLREDRQREAWQLEQWEAALRWYLNWLNACADAGADHRNLSERVRAAVGSACARRGLARRTKQCYGAWAARYAVFAGAEREVMREETPTRFLTAVVVDEQRRQGPGGGAAEALAGGGGGGRIIRAARLGAARPPAP